MEKHDYPWLQKWKATWNSIVIKPGDTDALSDLQAELHQGGESEHHCLGSIRPLKNGLGVLEAFFHFFLGSCRVVIMVFS